MKFPFMYRMYLNAFPDRRAEFVEVLSDDVMDGLDSHLNSHEDYVILMDLLRPLVNCPSMLKIGIKQSGKWICGLDTFLANKNVCQVYAFNWNVTNLSFEFEVLQKTECIVHVFDPFLPLEYKEKIRNLHPKLVFHDYTLGPERDTRYLLDELEPELRSVEERKFHSITSKLEHRWVDVVKMDYRDEEADKLMEVLGNWRSLNQHKSQKVSFPVGQMLFTLHTGGAAILHVESMLALMNLGFAVYHAEPNLRTERPWENVAFSVINMRDARTFATASNADLVS